MMTSKENIDLAIDDILRKEEETCEQEKQEQPAKRRGPWALHFYDPERNLSFALISICIKENPFQSIEELALRLSIWKLRPVAECLSVLRHLKKKGMLGYYDEFRVFRAWNGKEGGYGLEGLRG